MLYHCCPVKENNNKKLLFILLNECIIWNLKADRVWFQNLMLVLFFENKGSIFWFCWYILAVLHRDIIILRSRSSDRNGSWYVRWVTTVHKLLVLPFAVTGLLGFGSKGVLYSCINDHKSLTLSNPEKCCWITLIYFNSLTRLGLHR